MGKPHHKALRGSESSRTLKRRLDEKAAGCWLSDSSAYKLTPASLNDFFLEQQRRCKRVAQSSVDRVRSAHERRHHEDERASRVEAILGFDVISRGSCGSDVHLGTHQLRRSGSID